MVRVRSAIHRLGNAVRIDGELERVGALWTKRPLVDGTFRIAFDIDDLPVLRVDKLATTDGAVRADTLDFGSAPRARTLLDRFGAERLVLEGTPDFDARIVS